MDKVILIVLGCAAAIVREISLCDYLDLWLAEKKTKLVEVNAKDLDEFYRYCLKYGKTNQKTHEREPMAVRSVRSYKSILYAAFTQAAIDESDNTKTPEGRRSLNLFPVAEKCLLRVKEEQEENREFFKGSYQNLKGYVFTWEDGRCYLLYNKDK